MPEGVSVSIHAMTELAVEWWRFQRWLANQAGEQDQLPVRHFARQVAGFLQQAGFCAEDLTGRMYDPGLAVEVVEKIESDEEKNSVIGEMITPIIYFQGNVVKPGRVVLGGSNHLREGAS